MRTKRERRATGSVDSNFIDIELYMSQIWTMLCCAEMGSKSHTKWWLVNHCNWRCYQTIKYWYSLFADKTSNSHLLCRFEIPWADSNSIYYNNLLFCASIADGDITSGLRAYTKRHCRTSSLWFN